VLCNPIPILHVAEDFNIFLGENISAGMIAHIRKYPVQNTYYIDENKVMLLCCSGEV